ncbi:MAG: hypothetical protein ABSC87_08985 [Halobacteriota archaeon]|jgi:hypothetical protein
MTNWKRDLNEFFREKEHQDPEAQTAIERYASAASKFYETRVNPAFEGFASELERHGRNVFFRPPGEIRENRVCSSIEVYFEGRLEFDYTLCADISSSGIRLGKEIASIDEERIAFAAQKTGKLQHENELLQQKLTTSETLLQTEKGLNADLRRDKESIQKQLGLVTLRLPAPKVGFWARLFGGGRKKEE